MNKNKCHALRYWLMIAFIGLFLGAPAANTSQSIIPQNVLILLSAEYGLPAYDLILQEIRTKLQDRVSGPINLFAEYLDSARFPDTRYLQDLFNFYNEKYAHVKIDLLIAVGPNMLPIIDRYDHSGLSELPTLSMELIEPNAEIPSAFRRPNRTGIFFEIEVKKSLDLALALHPDAAQVFIIFGGSFMDAYLENLARAAGREYEKTIKINYFKGLSMETILSRVAALPDDSVVLVLSSQMEANGVPYYTREATRLIAARSNAPVYILFDSNADVGAVGGYVISFKKGGDQAGEIALRILQGEPPGAIAPVRGGLSHYMFDWRQLQRWAIPEHRLPEGSIVTHRQINFLQKYKWHAIGILLFVTLQSLLISFLIIFNRKQRRLSADLLASERRYRHFLRVERASRLGELSGSLAHEINQPLAAILSSSQAALRFLNSNPGNIERLREILQNIVHDNKRATGVIRSMRAMLKREQEAKAPVLINDIVDDVLTIFQGEAHARNIHIETQRAPAILLVMADKSQLQQVLLNLIMNAADAVSPTSLENRKVVVTTRIKGGNVQLSVRDFGPGIDEDKIDKVLEPFFTTKIGGVGMGLALCRTIITEHGGRLRMENHADGGADVTFELPGIHNG